MVYEYRRWPANAPLSTNPALWTKAFGLSSGGGVICALPAIVIPKS